jgi:YesN/AraC family two-component response regulator
MKVVPFTIPVADENTVVVQEEILSHFYNHLHRHAEMQITWIINGEGNLIAGNYMQPFKSGDIYIIGSNQPHLFKSNPEYFDEKSDKKIHSLTFFLNPNGLIKPVLDLPEMKSIKNFLSTTTHGLKAPTSYQKKIAEAMVRVNEQKHSERLAVLIQLLHLISNIQEWKTLSTVTTANSFTDSEGLRMNDILQYTVTHYTENIPLKKIASVSHLTPQAFCRYFKKHTRKTYMNFLNEVRINEACKKILEGKFGNISSVAYQTGFNNLVTFNRIFKKIIKKSPSLYIKDYIGKIE